MVVAMVTDIWYSVNMIRDKSCSTQDNSMKSWEVKDLIKLEQFGIADFNLIDLQVSVSVGYGDSLNWKLQVAGGTVIADL